MHALRIFMCVFFTDTICCFCQKPAAVIRPQCTLCRSDGKNHCVNDTSHPKLTALCVGAKVMPLKNFTVECKLMNGAMGIVVDVVCETEQGPNDDTVMCPLPACVTVDFKNCTLPTHERMSDQFPVTCVPVPVIKDRCEKNCCSMATVPLHVCKAVTTCKSQGMTVGPSHVWEQLVVTLPRENARNKTCGSELVAFSRVTDLQHLVIDDHEGVPNTLEHC